MPYHMQARAETSPGNSYVYFMKIIYMQLHIDISEKDILLQE